MGMRMRTTNLKCRLGTIAEVKKNASLADKFGLKVKWMHARSSDHYVLMAMKKRLHAEFG